MDGNRRTVLTVSTVLTTNRATAGKQSERTADEQGFCGCAWRGSEYTRVPAHTTLFTVVGALVILFDCLSGDKAFSTGGVAQFRNAPAPSFQRSERNRKITQSQKIKAKVGQMVVKVFFLCYHVLGKERKAFFRYRPGLLGNRRCEELPPLEP